MEPRPRSSEQDSRPAFTVIVCDSCPQHDAPPILATLRETVRNHPHAVLVRSPCPVGSLWCRTRRSQLRGTVVLVQRCTSKREPLGAMIPIGPVRTTEDLTALTRWLESTQVTIADLPARLRGILDVPHHAAQN